jgi:cytochrome c oxidase subunit II
MRSLLPIAGSGHAAQLDTITLFVHILMVVLFVGWGTFFVYTLVRFRASRHPRASDQGVTSRLPLWSEGAVVVAELLLLVGFSIPAWASRVNDLPRADQATVVRVVAEQFTWNAHYPGADGRFGRTEVTLIAADNPLGLDRRSPFGADDVVSVGVMGVPIDRPVLVQLSAKDVIHSFGVPAMRVKQDAIPGMVTPVWFTPIVSGDFDIACSQLCGFAHYRMRGVLKVMTEGDFRAWLTSR